MKTPITALVAVLALAMSASFANAAKGGAGFDINKDGPRIERGERINWEPKGVQREPSVIDKVIDTIKESPVVPTIKDGQPAILIRGTF